jgi:hypothetical protein
MHVYYNPKCINHISSLMSKDVAYYAGMQVVALLACVCLYINVDISCDFYINEL